MKRKGLYLPVIIIGIIIVAGLIIPFSLVVNNSIVLSRIYYEINHKGDVQNLESIIERSELFEFDKYCKYRDSWGEGPVNNSDYYYRYIDNELIENLKFQIDIDKNKSHFYLGYRHNFIYSMEVTNESMIYLTYNLNNIIKAEYANHTEIFAADRVWDYNSNRYTLNWEGIWYLNFTQLPLVLISPSIIALNDTFLVKMNLEYHYSCGWACSGDVRMEQFLCFNSDIQLIFEYAPFPLHSVT